MLRAGLFQDNGTSLTTDLKGYGVRMDRGVRGKLPRPEGETGDCTHAHNA